MEKTQCSVRMNELPLTVEAFDVVFAHTPSCFNVALIRAASRVTRTRPDDAAWAEHGRSNARRGGGKKRHSYSQPWALCVNAFF